MKIAQEIESELPAFCGSENWYRHWTGRLVYTDGVCWLAGAAEAWWLVDMIAAHQPECGRDRMLQEIQFWKLSVADGTGVLTCLRDTDDIAITRRIASTSFPLREIKMIAEASECGVPGLMLPSER